MAGTPGGPPDGTTGTLGNMFDFQDRGDRTLFLDPSSGEPGGH